MKFPSDLGSNNDYKGVITFSIVSSKDTGTSTSAINRLVSETFGETEIANFTGSSSGRSSTAKGNRTVKPDKENGSVSLYLPPGLQFRDNVEYGTTDLGISGALAEQGAGIINSLVEDRQSFIEALKGGISSQSGPLARLIAVEASKLNPAKLAGAKAAAQVQAGVTINPNTRTLFKRVSLREFAFSFKLIAKNSTEANTVEQIIKFFRTQLYPETFNLNGVGVGYKFPEQFEININYTGSDGGSWSPPKINNCYLKDVSTTYNASSMAYHKDGKPLEVDLSLSFTEAKALERADIQKPGG